MKRSLVPFSVLGLFLGLASAHAQAPAAAGAAAGRGGGRGAAPALSTIQQLAASKMQVPAALTAAATAALADLTRASLTQPASPADLSAKAAALATAETSLALARVDEFAKVQASLEKLTPTQAVTAFGGGGGRGGGIGNNNAAAAAAAAAAAFKDSEGFVSIFNGKDLTGWDGEDNVWSVTPAPAALGGAPSIHSDNVSRSTGQHHVHFVGIPGVSPILKDFELKVEFYIEGGNGGIHYRSRLLNGAYRQDSEAALTATGTREHASAIADPIGKRFAANLTNEAAALAAGVKSSGTNNLWQISGYQFDITGNNTGSLYEGQGRGVVANTGEMIILHPGAGANNRTVVAQTSDVTWGQFGRPDGWNEAWIIARGNTLVHILNGRVFTVAVDDDVARRASQGIISLQLEGTGKIWYRSVRLKQL
jgi:hypothetical protein